MECESLMDIEVEQKFAVEDLAKIELQLEQLQATLTPRIEQIDLYYAHPVKDFAHTDEALRIRQVGEQAWVTYKGPKLDQQTKTRHELEIRLPAESRAAENCQQLFQLLGFTPAGEVRKFRRTAILQRDDHHVEVALDEVHGLGSFVEIETRVSESELTSARKTVQMLASELGLVESERSSYLELLASSTEC